MSLLLIIHKINWHYLYLIINVILIIITKIIISITMALSSSKLIKLQIKQKIPYPIKINSILSNFQILFKTLNNLKTNKIIM